MLIMKKIISLLVFAVLFSGCSVTGKAVAEIKNETIQGVSVISLIDPLCPECGNNMIHYQRLRLFGTIIKEFKNINYRAEQGMDLIRRYNITKIPTVIIENMSVSMNAYGFYRIYGNYYGNTYVFRKPESIAGFAYRDLTTNKVQKTIEVVGSFFREFKKTTEQMCYENGKPVVYFFSENPWETEVMNRAMLPFSGKVVFYSNTNYGIFSDYPGSSETKTIFGCTYYRDGLPEEFNEEREIETLSVMACVITGGAPSEVCSKYSGLLMSV